MDSSLISRTARMSGSSSTTSARAALTAGSSWLGAHDGARHLGGHSLSGQAHDEPAATVDLGLHRHGPAVGLHEALDDGEAQPGAAPAEARAPAGATARGPG